MKSEHYIVTETHDNKVLQAIVCDGLEKAEKEFVSLVKEYGIDVVSEHVEEGIFAVEGDNTAYTIQILKGS